MADGFDPFAIVDVHLPAGSFEDRVRMPEITGHGKQCAHDGKKRLISPSSCI
jgi:hypothetical protein